MKNKIFYTTNDFLEQELVDENRKQFPGYDSLTHFGYNNLPINNVVQSALELAQAQLQSFANSPDFRTQMQFAFGGGIDPTRLQKAWQNQNFSVIPHIQIRSGVELGGAIGAFASATNTIYISQEYLSQNAANIDSIASVLLEEVGHAVDTHLNTVDTPGDEGEIFSALVQGQRFEQRQLQQMLAEDDTKMIILDGQPIQIEQATVSDSGGFEGSREILKLESKGGGTAQYFYQMYDIPDQLILRYEGKEILNTGFVSGSKTGRVNIPKGNSNELEVILATNDIDTGWDYKVDTSSFSNPLPLPLIKDSIYEFLAKDVVYKNGKKTEDGGVEPWQLQPDVGNAYNVSRFKDLVSGYKVDKVFDDSKTGFFALGLTSNQGRPSVLAIRGTEPTDLGDILADLDSEVIGLKQFENNKVDVLNWLNSQEDRPDITGHSLGGALAQLFAAEFTNEKNKGKLGDIVTFNSPGINGNQAKNFNPNNAERVKHYIVSGDIVSLAGETFLPGTYDLLDFFNFNLLDNHLLPILTQEVNYDKPTYDKPSANGTIKNLTIPEDLEQKLSDAPVELLNNPFFTYVEPEYLTYVGGALALTQVPNYPLNKFEDLPPLLLFRGTVEGSRKRIGEGVEQIAKAINLDALRSGTGVRVPLPKQNFNILGLLDINATNLGVEYVSKPEEIFKIQGKVSVPTLFNAAADFAGDNFIQISKNGLDVKGSLSVKDISIVPNVWEVKKAQISFDTIGKEVKGEGAVLIPTGIEIGGGIGFRNGQFNFISLTADKLNKPIGATGAFLQKISGKIDNVADINQIHFDGGIGITGGPEVSVSLPSWAGGGFSGSLVELDVNGSIYSDRLKGDGSLKIIGGLAQGTASSELNWNEKLLIASSEFSIFNDFIKTKADFKANPNFDIMIGGQAEVKAPDISIDAPKFNIFGQEIGGGKINIKGQQLSEGNFVLNYSNDNNLSNDFVQAYGKLPLLTFPNLLDLSGKPSTIQLEATIKVSFDGKVEAIPGKAVPQTNSFTISPGAQWILLNANWDNASANVPVQVKTPSGTILNESDFAANNIVVVDAFTRSTTKAVIVANPQAGVWDIKVADTTGLGNVQYSAFRDSIVPTVQVTDPAYDVTGQNVVINYNAFDADSNAKVSLFYDTDNQNFDGILIKDGLAETDGAGNFIWNTEGVPTGDYYVYAMVLDENNAPVFSYSPGRVRVSETADLFVTKTANTDPVTVESNLTYTITVTNKGANNTKGVILKESLPENVKFVSASVNPTQQSANNLTFDLGNIDNDASKTVNITVTPSKTGIITSTSRVTAKTFDPDATNDVAVLATSVHPVSTDLVLTTTDSPPKVNLGDKITYKLTVTNNGSTTATGVTLIDYLPSEVRTGQKQNGQSEVSVTSSKGTTEEINGVVTANLGDLNKGETATVTITATTIAAGTVINTARVTSNEDDPNTANNSLIQSTTVNPVDPAAADLELSQTVDFANPVVGSQVKFTLTLTNKGPGTASSIKVLDLLPAGLTFESAVADQGSYNSTTGVWDVGNIRDNLSRNLTIAARVTSAGAIANTAEVIAVSEKDPDSVPGNNNPAEDDQTTVILNQANATSKLTKASSDIFTISGDSGKPKLSVTLTGNSSNLVNELGVFVVDDATGTINGIAPSADGYAQAALDRSKVIFSALANVPEGFITDPTSLLEFNSGENLRFYLVRNSTTDAVRAGLTPLTEVLFSDASTQQVTELSDQEFSLAWEDAFGDSFNNFQDMVVKIKATNQPLPLGAGVQGSPQGELIDLRGVTSQVKAEFVLNREAAFNNFVGFFKVADVNGGIDVDGNGTVDLRPGDADYTQAAVRSRASGIDLLVNNQATANFTATLSPGSLFAPFIIADGRPDATLDDNANNDPAVYFPFLGANPGKVDHIRLLGNNTFGFEDLPMGGDLDYNDVTVRVNLSIV